MAIKVDLEKAFDQLKWDFVEDTLQNAGLPKTLIKFIMTCITTPSMQVIWNGKLSQHFPRVEALQKVILSHLTSSSNAWNVYHKPSLQKLEKEIGTLPSLGDRVFPFPASFWSMI